jgi:hypothetical protein
MRTFFWEAHPLDFVTAVFCFPLLVHARAGCRGWVACLNSKPRQAHGDVVYLLHSVAA